VVQEKDVLHRCIIYLQSYSLTHDVGFRSDCCTFSSFYGYKSKLVITSVIVVRHMSLMVLYLLESQLVGNIGSVMVQMRTLGF